jgi:hypothetical protein
MLMGRNAWANLFNCAGKLVVQYAHRQKCDELLSMGKDDAERGEAELINAMPFPKRHASAT